MRTVAERWQEYEAALLDPIDAGEVQRQEARRAFYAGFYNALMAFTEVANVSDDDDEAAKRMITALHVECHEFRDAVMAGRA